MYNKKLIAVFLVIFLYGCATTRKSQNIQLQQLQSRINYLETELQRKNQEVKSLENELKEYKQTLTQETIKKDSESLDLSVRQIQTALKNAGFYKGQIDGKMGPQTIEAVKTFQRTNGLKPDGIVGKQTSKKLSKYLP